MPVSDARAAAAALADYARHLILGVAAPQQFRVTMSGGDIPMAVPPKVGAHLEIVVRARAEQGTVKLLPPPKSEPMGLRGRPTEVVIPLQPLESEVRSVIEDMAVLEEMFGYATPLEFDVPDLAERR